MTNFTFLPEPYRIKMVEPIHLLPPQERVEALRRAGYNPFSLRSSEVYIDLLTDSGTGAMSDRQWAALMMGDESYAGSSSFYQLESTAQELFGYQYIIPAHQGRGAEQVLFPQFIKPGQDVIGNMHFDTTMAHISLAGGIPVNLVHERAYDTQLEHPFKGDTDLDQLRSYIVKRGAENIAFCIITITCNSAGGQPVSMANIKAVSEICQEYGVLCFMDAARFAENAYFIKKREAGYAHQSIKSIIREMFSYTQAFTLSAKKDGLVNIGGLIGIKDNREWYEHTRSVLVPLEGFPTYGGMAGRDMAALAVGLQEVVTDEYLEARVYQIEYLATRLQAGGVPFQSPVGGHAVFLDAKKILPHIPFHQYPAQALCNEIYLEGGIRPVEIGSFLLGRDATGVQLESPLELVRLTIPRRVYTISHLEYVAAICTKVMQRASDIKGIKITYEPPVLRHFTARLEPLS
ncbi:MAG: tryptophanase [Symbiobacteriaceae bacterium]|nr:tryptophanase [Symbiobacteriaceae bacterium]